MNDFDRPFSIFAGHRLRRPAPAAVEQGHACGDRGLWIVAFHPLGQPLDRGAGALARQRDDFPVRSWTAVGIAGLAFLEGHWTISVKVWFRFTGGFTFVIEVFTLR